MASLQGFSTPRGPFASAAPLAHRPLSAIVATVAGGVPERRILRILAELIPVLDALHEQGRICGDISVHSVGLDESGHAHLMALDAHSDPADRLRALAPGYAPFELYTESPQWPRGPWTDVYALSAVVYSLVAGQRPPPATERYEDDVFQPLTSLGLGKYTEAFLLAIDAGLALNPADRPQSMQKFAESLGLPLFSHPAAFTLGMAAGAPLETLPTIGVTGQGTSVRQRRSLWLIVPALLLVIATIGLGSYWWGRSTVKPEQVITRSERAVESSQTEAVPIPSSLAVFESPTSPAEAIAQTPPVTQAQSALVSVTSPLEQVEPAETTESQADSGPEVAAVATTEETVAKVDRKTSAPVRVSINVRPWGEIIINGVSRGVTPPLKTVMLRPGKYSVTIRNTAQAPFHTTLIVTSGKPAVITHAFR